METIICWISKIPNVVWSAVIASCLTFAGVYLTNRGNERRQKSLLEHEKEKFRTEQQHALKKDVFLSVAGSFSNVLELFPNLINLEFTEKEVSQKIEGHGSLVAKSYLVAKEETLSEILKFSADVSEALIPLMRDRAQLIDTKGAINIYNDAAKQARQEKERYLRVMEELKLKSSLNPSLFEYLEHGFETQDKISEEMEKKMEEQNEALKLAHLAFAKKCLTEHGRLLTRLPPMTIAIRKELENDGESVVFVNALNETIERKKHSYEKLFNG